MREEASFSLHYNAGASHRARRLGANEVPSPKILIWVKTKRMLIRD